MAPAFSALEAFPVRNVKKIEEYSPEENHQRSYGLWLFNLKLAEKGLTHGLKASPGFPPPPVWSRLFNAWPIPVNQQKGEDILRPSWPEGPG